jgi:hypothetical protein
MQEINQRGAVTGKILHNPINAGMLAKISRTLAEIPRKTAKNSRK